MIRNRTVALLAAAVAGTASISNAQLLNGSFENLAGPGEFLWANWLNFGNANLNDLEVIPFDGFLAAKTFGAFFYQFPFGIDGLPPEMQALLPASAVPYNTLPTNNTVILQVFGNDDGVPESFAGECFRVTARYYQRSDADVLDPAANLPQLSINFRDEPFPAPTIGGSFSQVTVATAPNDEWIELSTEAIAPANTDFAEVLLLHFQMASVFNVVDANNDGIQDTNGQGFPAFEIIEWGGGAAHWDDVTLETVPDGCGAACTADWNSDEAVNIFDILDYLNDWNSGDPAADLDGQGGNTIFDILDFLGQWNAGCP